MNLDNKRESSIDAELEIESTIEYGAVVTR